jgi:hypothetical protein
MVVAASRIPQANRSRGCNQPINQVVVNAALNQNTLGGAAYLPGVEKASTRHGCAHRIEIGVVQNDGWLFPPSSSRSDFPAARCAMCFPVRGLPVNPTA